MNPCYTVTVIDRTFAGDRNYTVPFCLSLEEAIARVRRTEHLPSNHVLVAIWGKL
jgi:hypothetical protein